MIKVRNFASFLNINYLDPRVAGRTQSLKVFLTMHLVLLKAKLMFSNDTMVLATGLKPK